MASGSEMREVLDAAVEAVDARGEPGEEEIQEASADMVLDQMEGLRQVQTMVLVPAMTA